ncbi:MAG: polysaccharide deacetylase family protein [Planctomycetes bacterium]|nr:polysaccharide deacetylase family protein [Planctomycetota bacterium]
MSNPRLPLLPLVLDNVPWGLRQALAQEGIPVCQHHAGTPEGRFLLFDSRSGFPRPAAADQVPIDVDSLRGVTSGDALAALVDEQSRRYCWEIGTLRVCERIAQVDRRAVRRLVLQRLRQTIERRGGVWLRISPFPFPYRSAWNFRIDHDRYEPEDFDRLLAVLEGHESATTHFVNAAAFRGQTDALGRLAGLDVGSHGYWHHTYRSTEENLHNIRRGIESLTGAGLRPSGFAAPHGSYHRPLAAAMKSLGIAYSSEFGLAYDDLPLLPEPGGVLQVPVHPVSLGLFLEAAKRQSGDSPEAYDAAVSTAIDYYGRVIRDRHRAGEPVFLYGHPTGRLGRYPRLLQSVFESAGSLSTMWRTTLGEFVRWWRYRGTIRLRVSRRDDRFVMAADVPSGPFRVAVEYFRQQHVALLPLQAGTTTFSPTALAYRNSQAHRVVQPVRIDRPEGLRGRIRRIIDWEKETPVEEIETGNWRNWIKRTLRRWRD